jgi:hypothetical protein
LQLEIGSGPQIGNTTDIAMDCRTNRDRALPISKRRISSTIPLSSKYMHDKCGLSAFRTVGLQTEKPRSDVHERDEDVMTL